MKNLFLVIALFSGSLFSDAQRSLTVFADKVISVTDKVYGI